MARGSLTYTVWHSRSAGFAECALCTNKGAMLTFAATRAERLVVERLLLAEDAQAMITAMITAMIAATSTRR